jgi:hypothetical protein
MHKFLIYLSIFFCLTCFGLSISPSSEAGVQLCSGSSLLGTVSAPGRWHHTRETCALRWSLYRLISRFSEAKLCSFLQGSKCPRNCKDGWKRFYLLGRTTAPKNLKKKGENPWLRLGKPDGSQSKDFSVYTDFFSRIMIILFPSLFFTLLIQLLGSLIYLSKCEITLLSSITFIYPIHQPRFIPRTAHTEAGQVMQLSQIIALYCETHQTHQLTCVKV